MAVNLQMSDHELSRRLRVLATAALAALVVVGALQTGFDTGPAAAATGSGPSLSEMDVAGFSSRAAAWTRASTKQRGEALTRAEALGAAAQAEQDRLAAEAEADAKRQAAARAAATTTLAPPTTVAPTTVAPTTVAPTTVAPTTVPPTTTQAPDPGAAPTADQWAALRHCESGGRYDAVSSNGRYRGAYQFSQATWDWVAGVSNPALRGVDPAGASPADQDAQALALWNMRGSSPWPHCGAHLN